MKKLTALLMSLMLMMLAGSALANSWGLKGELYNAVSADKRWNDYTTYGKQVGNAAVMQSRYHHALMMMENGKLQVYTTAVWQPDDKQGVPKLQGGKGDSLTLSYGEEAFSFVLRDGQLQLDKATAGEITMTYDGRRYIATDGQEAMVLQRQFPLHTFNIRNFPRSMVEVKRLNMMYAKLDSGRDALGWYSPEEEFGRRHTGLGKGTSPVYSAPFGKSAWRASNGKAAVSLKGDVWLLGCRTNQEGEKYACIRYEVSQRTQRIGYVKASDLKLDLTDWTETTDDFINVQVYAAADTFLTDDPLCSQFAQFDVPAGTQFTCMGTLNEEYAYVAAEVNGDAFVSGGKIIWGFVPLKDLMYKAMPDDQDAMSAAAGYWWYYAGGSMQADSLHLRKDGTFIANMGEKYYGEDEDSQRGKWYLSKYHDAENLYWNNPPYEITFLYDDGRCVKLGFVMNGADEFSLTNWEGGGGYQRIPEEEADTLPRPSGRNG